jgi:WD40 repeat protein
VKAEPSQDGKQLIFKALDPARGAGRELARFDIGPEANYWWEPSPDGTRVATVKGFDNRFHIISLEDQTRKDVIVKGWTGLRRLAWAPDGKEMFISCQERNNAVLLSVDLQGNAQVLWKHEGSIGTSGIPSPDGRHLAMAGSSTNDNIWMIENF